MAYKFLIYKVDRCGGNSFHLYNSPQKRGSSNWLLCLWIPDQVGDVGEGCYGFIIARALIVIETVVSPACAVGAGMPASADMAIISIFAARW